MEPFIQAAPEIDVNALMAAIEKQIQERKDAGLLKQSDIDEIVDMELQPLPDFQDIPNVYEPVLYPGFEASVAPAPPAEESFGEKGPAKAVLKALRRLLGPWRRFMNRPLYLELKGEIAGLRRHALHAWRLTIPHPDGGERTFAAPIPPDLAALLPAGLAPKG